MKTKCIILSCCLFFPTLLFPALSPRQAQAEHRARQTEEARLETYAFIDEPGADPNAISDVFGKPHLFCIVKIFRDLNLCELFFEKNADPNIRDAAGKTPLHEVDQEDMARLLLENKADPTIKCDNGQTPLFQAIEDSRSSKVLAVLTRECHYNPYERDDDGNTPLLALLSTEQDDRDFKIGLLIESTSIDDLPRLLSQHNHLQQSAFYFEPKLRKVLQKAQQEAEKQTLQQKRKQERKPAQQKPKSPIMCNVPWCEITREKYQRPARQKLPVPYEGADL